MGFKLLKRNDYLQGSENAFISLRTEHIGFNKVFTILAKLAPDMRVTIYPNDDTRQIGFYFCKGHSEDSMGLMPQSSSKTRDEQSSYSCTLGALRVIPWVKGIIDIPSVKHRRFVPILQDTEFGKLWIITLRPAFEIKKSRESDKIATTDKGIYRYSRAGEVVYIGRGNIRDRRDSESRKQWEFDQIEYSVISDPDEQVKWEDYYLEEFKKEHSGGLPLYNKISGCSNFRETKNLIKQAI